MENNSNNETRRESFERNICAMREMWFLELQKILWTAFAIIKQSAMGEPFPPSRETCESVTKQLIDAGIFWDAAKEKPGKKLQTEYENNLLNFVKKLNMDLWMKGMAL